MTTANGPTITSPVVSNDDPQTPVATPISNGAAPVEPAAPAPAVDPVAAPVVDPAPAVDPAAPVEPASDNKSTPEWAQKRINELTAKRYEAERVATMKEQALLKAETANAELLARLAAVGAPDGAQPIPGVRTEGMSQADIEKLVNERAAVIAQQNEFTRTCNKVVDNGKQEFKDSWDEAVKNLGLVGALGPDGNLDFLETAVELDNPHQILHYLGTNLSEAERITKLPPKKMAMEMARIEASLKAPKATPTPAPLPPISQAPAPVIPVGGAPKPGALSIDDPNLSTAEFMAMRNKQVEDKRNRYRR